MSEVKWCDLFYEKCVVELTILTAPLRARTWTSFVSQRISVAAQLAMAQEAAEALGLSVAADPRGQ